jgi:hypothetical protein
MARVREGCLASHRRFTDFTRLFKSRTAVPEADTLCWNDGAQVWVVPVMQS